ncbi:MAG: transketolase [Firmicutes bacterium]|jgi:transketolase|nr:transketolase [Bacillota bacterium]
MYEIETLDLALVAERSELLKVSAIDQLAVNTIRFLAVDAIEKANSGHPGLPMGGAAMAYVLWSRFLKHCPADPAWPNRDRFVLSAGHGSMLLYALLHLSGYDLSLDDLKNFRQWDSKTPGHPEYGRTPGVETTTGPLGQGFANAVGMALGERRLAAEFNRPGYPIVDHYTYVYAGDGCLMEGIAAEAASLAGHLKLGKLICLYDDNGISIDGSTKIAFTEDVGKRFAAYGWQVLKVADGNDLEAVARAIEEARRDSARPSLIMVRTVIGFGAPNKQGRAVVHGAPLGAEELRLSKEQLCWPLEPTFYVPEAVRSHFARLQEGWLRAKAEWEAVFAEYRRAYPDLARRWEAWHSGKPPASLFDDPALWEVPQKAAATRSVSGQVMQVVAARMPNLIGGSADLSSSTMTYLHGAGDFQADNPAGNNIHFGVREHAMAAILAGLTLHGGFRCFGSTFLVFCDYMKPAVRMAALMALPVIYIFTHDSIAVGEDGPTHQPVEHLANLRSIPNLHVFRPADGRETVAAWLHALRRTGGPTALILTRQELPQLEETGPAALRGGYVLRREGGHKLDLIIMATGSEVAPALEAQRRLQEKGFSVRLVSLPCWELFREQDEAYRAAVLPPQVEKRLAVEAALPMGWEIFTGAAGRIIGLHGFGASAPGELLMEKMGFSAEHIVAVALEMLEG